LRVKALGFQYGHGRAIFDESAFRTPGENSVRMRRRKDRREMVMHSRFRFGGLALGLALTGVVAGVVSVTDADAQLASPNAAGAAVGHIHFRVSDVDLHRGFWQSLGAAEVPGGIGGMLEVPGTYLLFTGQAPSGGSQGTSMDHVGFLTRDYAQTKAALEAVNAEIAVDNAETGQIIAGLPEGVRVELQACGTPTEFDECPSLSGPIAFHHFHASTTAGPLDGPGLAQWYIDAFGMELGERRGSPSAVVPGGRIDMLGGFGGGRGGGRGAARGGAPAAAPAAAGPVGTRGRAIDHIGLEVTDLAGTVARLEGMGIQMDSAPRSIGNLTIAFLTDPNGTYIELTQGLGQ
jgi:catechol 2,3-dioxygenase-like lactoylglutathione lyase family enzyme